MFFRKTNIFPGDATVFVFVVFFFFSKSYNRFNRLSHWVFHHQLVI